MSAGDAKKVLSGAKGGAGKELSHVKKAAVPVHKVAAKDAAGLKKAVGMKQKASLKAMTPARSALVRQKKLAGHGLAGPKSTMGKDIGGIKKAAQTGKAGSSMKVGAVAKKAKPKLKRPPKLGRLFGAGVR